MGLEDIKEIKEVSDEEEVNSLLTKDWRLLDLKIEKLSVRTGREQAGTDWGGSSMAGFEGVHKYTTVYEDQLGVLYVLGRYK